MEMLMARQPQTKEQIAARVAKAQATKSAKKANALALMGVAAKKSKTKVSKSRNMTAEQKAAAVARLAAAREAKGPSQNTMIDADVRNLPDDDTFSLKNVRQWIKTNKELLVAMRGMKESKEASERASYANVETYVANLEAYLRSGHYLDFRFGENGQNKVTYVCRAMAYYANGHPKRSVGVLYADIGLYTQEMEDDDRRKAIPHKTKICKAD
jgi:hypothetical protein